LKENELIGTFALARQEVRPFNDKQIAVVTNFAAQAVIAIENARLLSELRERTTDLTEALEQQTATSQVLQVISSSPGDLEPVFSTMLEKAVWICDASFGNIYSRDGDEFRLVAAHKTPPAFAEYRKRSPLVRTSGSGRSVTTKTVTHVTDLLAEDAYINRDPPFVAAFELGGVRTYLSVPMLKENELIGALILSGDAHDDIACLIGGNPLFLFPFGVKELDNPSEPLIRRWHFPILRSDFPTISPQKAAPFAAYEIWHFHARQLDCGEIVVCRMRVERHGIFPPQWASSSISAMPSSCRNASLPIVNLLNAIFPFSYLRAALQLRNLRCLASPGRRGVCRDFAHLAITLCRCMNIPARYCTGYLGDIGVPPAPEPMDFSAWFEVFLGERCYTFDARHNVPRIGRILMARGRDATDVAISTSFGPRQLTGFKVLTDEVSADGESHPSR
jgi:Transglutaminase-like superfamily/GAF domain